MHILILNWVSKERWHVCISDIQRNPYTRNAVSKNNKLLLYVITLFWGEDMRFESLDIVKSNLFYFFPHIVSAHPSCLCCDFTCNSNISSNISRAENSVAELFRGTWNLERFHTHTYSTSNFQNIDYAVDLWLWVLISCYWGVQEWPFLNSDLGWREDGER